MFLHDLALELKMPVGEMCRRMTAQELCVDWPLYMRYRAREQKNAESGAGPASMRTLGGGAV